METIFSKIIRKEIPADIVFENERILAFNDIHPVAPVHVVIIPKKEVASLAAITEEDKGLVGEILLLAKTLAEQKGIAESGYRVVTNSGEDSTRGVEHLHFHLIGGKRLGSKIG